MNSEFIASIYESTPSLKFCDRFNGSSPLWDYSRHKHPYIEFLYHINGHGYRKVLDMVSDITSDTVSDTPQNFSSFDIVVYPVDCWHEDGSLPDFNNEVYCLWADIPGIKLDHSIKIQDQEGEFEYLFREIYEEHQKPDSIPQIVSLLIRVLLIKILRYEEESGTSSIDRIIQYIKLHMTEQISLDHLIHMEHISKSFLTKHFKQRTDMTVVQYVHFLRIKAAKRLLITTRKSVEEIASEVGFDSPKYFYRLFKDKVGISPNRYRKAKSVNIEKH